MNSLPRGVVSKQVTLIILVKPKSHKVWHFWWLGIFVPQWQSVQVGFLTDNGSSEELANCPNPPKRSWWQQLGRQARGTRQRSPATRVTREWPMALLGIRRRGVGQTPKAQERWGRNRWRPVGSGSGQRTWGQPGLNPKCPSPFGVHSWGITLSSRPHPTRGTLTERHFPGCPWHKQAHPLRERGNSNLPRSRRRCAERWQGAWLLA